MRVFDKRLLVALTIALAPACSTNRPQRQFYFPPKVASAPSAAAPTAVPVATTPPAPSGGYKGLGVESVPPEVLKKHAATPLPADVSRRIQALLDLRAPGAGLPSPDGKRLFFGWSITGTPQVFRLDGPMGFPTQLTGGEDPAQLSAVTPDGKWLVITRDRNGEENPGLYLLSPNGGPLQVIQHKPKVQTVFQWVSTDGSYLYYRANDVTPESYALYRYDLATKKTTKVFGEPGIWSIADVRSPGAGKPDVLLIVKSVGADMEEVFELDLGSGKAVPIIGQGEREEYVPGYGAGGEILVLTPKLGEFRRLYAWSAGKLTPITPELSHDVSSFRLDRQKRRIVYSTNESGYTKTFALDAKTKKPIKIENVPVGDHVSFGASTPDGKLTTVTVDPGNGPSRSYVYTWESKKLTAWHEPAAPEIDRNAIVKSTLESYPARDGTKIPMFVRRPADCARPGAASGKSCPVIVSFHGGPEAQTVAGFSTRAQLFVDSGFIYAEPNVRGSDGYGKSWIHADDGPKREAVLTDIEDASKFIRAQWKVGGSSPKVGVYGGSYGGYSVLIAMSLYAGAYDAGVSVVGISNLLTFLENTAPYRRILRISEYGDPEKDKAALERLSPTTYVDRVSAPLMLLQGATDPRVPVGEALQFHESLVKKGIPTELFIFPDEGHGFQKRPNVVLGMGHTIRFFKQHLE
jgi:dipeptidyl aminopeptidase/acylaminoacyl peptidase